MLPWVPDQHEQTGSLILNANFLVTALFLRPQSLPVLVGCSTGVTWCKDESQVLFLPAPPIRPCPRPVSLGEEASWPRQRREKAGAPHVGPVPGEGGQSCPPASRPAVRGDPELRLPKPRGGAGPSRTAPTLRPLPAPPPRAGWLPGPTGWKPRRTPLCGNPRGWGQPRLLNGLTDPPPFALFWVGIYLCSKELIRISTFAGERACCEGEMQRPRKSGAARVVLFDLGPNPAHP